MWEELLCAAYFILYAALYPEKQALKKISKQFAFLNWLATLKVEDILLKDRFRFS